MKLNDQEKQRVRFALKRNFKLELGALCLYLFFCLIGFEIGPIFDFADDHNRVSDHSFLSGSLILPIIFLFILTVQIAFLITKLLTDRYWAKILVRENPEWDETKSIDER